MAEITNETKNNNENKMGTAPMLGLIMSMSLPAMFSMLVQALYNIVDSYFVAKISENALTAVSLAFPLQMLMISVAVGTGIGINSLISRRLGQKRFEEADMAATHGVILSVFSWLIFAVIGFTCVKMFFRSFTEVEEVFNMGVSYSQIVLIFSIGVFVEVSLEKTLQATGNMIYPMVFQLIGAVANIILDPIMIFGLLGFPAMGIAGAAAATVIGQIISMIYALYVVFAKEHVVKISLKNFKFDGKTVADIYKVGIPSIIMQSIGSVMLTLFNKILISFSGAAVAVLGVYYKLQSFVFMPVFGLTHGVMPIIGYNYGAKKRKRMLEALKYGCLIAVGIMGVGLILFMLIPNYMLMMFNASPQMLEIGVPALRIIALCFLPAALGIMFSTLFQAIGKGVNSLILSLLRQLFVILPVGYAMSKIGLIYVWTAFPIAEFAALIVGILMFASVNKNIIKKLGQ